MGTLHGRRLSAPVRCLPYLRHGVRARLTEWGAAALADDACLVLTELVANAERHGSPPVRVALCRRCGHAGRPGVRIEVSDGGRGLDPDAVRARWRHPSFALGPSGRGLYLVDALTHGAWGDRAAPSGHTVWADLGC
ncbi:ATP-binding protein [Streptomyces albogriseolus]|uniref:ATP-binding protein n=1 Tax=Streptomyces albogriseolus TaxID=1887 RepID=UPI003D71D664